VLDQLPFLARFAVVMIVGCAAPLAILFGAEWGLVRFAKWYDNRKKYPRAHTEPSVEEFIREMKRKGLLK
jgi:hypothetical protein